MFKDFDFFRVNLRLFVKHNGKYFFKQSMWMSSAIVVEHFYILTPGMFEKFHKICIRTFDCSTQGDHSEIFLKKNFKRYLLLFKNTYSIARWFDFEGLNI